MKIEEHPPKDKESMNIYECNAIVILNNQYIQPYWYPRLFVYGQ